MKNKIIYLISCFYVFFSCNSEKGKSEFEVKEFTPITNYQVEKKNNKRIEFDYTDAIDSGFVIPSVRQAQNGKFIFQFSIKNSGKQKQKFFYKIFYQNESYKISELKDGILDTLSSENFYGSWEEVNVGFKPTDEIPSDDSFHKISDSFRIIGNPRNERKYYGNPGRYFSANLYTKEDVDQMIVKIRNNQDWYKSVQEKALKNSISIEEQLEKDAVFSITSSYENVNANEFATSNRWKRNPRVGYYSFMLVVTTEENLKNKKIPDYIQNINFRFNGSYVNPFGFFEQESINKFGNISVIKMDSVIKAVSHPDLGKGIFIDINKFSGGKLDTSYYNKLCNSNYKMYKNAPFQQQVHTLASDVLLENIPVIADVTGGEYSIDDYNANAKKYDKSRIVKPVDITRCPCETVMADSIKKMITIINPGNKNNKFKKEDVGVLSRHGFTYGKIRAKVKLTSLLNEKQVWNGITNAIWLITESMEPWNTRRISHNGGYMPSYYSWHKEDIKVPTMSYSEIDFEILKASHRWPVASYKDLSLRPPDNPSLNDKIIVTCTNWDMACWDPENFNAGVQTIKKDNLTFYPHRWDHWSNALTLKTPEPESELFDSDFYLFEIEWKPTEIIWRIGPSVDKMRIVGYMNNTISAIPDNQMLLIITQEFHITKWWPEAPFSQDNIPFPAKDIKGYIYDVVME